MKNLVHFKSACAALFLAVGALCAVGCDDDSPIKSAAKSFEGNYNGTLVVSMVSQAYVDTLKDVTFTFVSNGDGTVNVTVPAMDVNVKTAAMTMTMDFGSYQIDNIPVVGGAGVAVTGSVLDKQTSIAYSDIPVTYSRNGVASNTTVEGTFSAAVAKDGILINYTFCPGSMKAAGLSLTGDFAGKK